NQAVISSTLFAQSCKASRMSFSYRARLYIPATPPLWPLNVVCYRLTNMWEKLAGAPEEIRTPDPQIRSLVLYPAELRALEPLAKTGPRHGIAIDFVTYWQGLPLAALPAPARRASCRDARTLRLYEQFACTLDTYFGALGQIMRRAQYPRPPASRACPRAPAVATASTSSAPYLHPLRICERRPYAKNTAGSRLFRFRRWRVHLVVY